MSLENNSRLEVALLIGSICKNQMHEMLCKFPNGYDDFVDGKAGELTGRLLELSSFKNLTLSGSFPSLPLEITRWLRASLTASVEDQVH